ncbi:MAG: hypothetical protein QOE63_256 [Acidimicrobiaceae bacterium]
MHALLRHLEGKGFDGAPRALGVDEQGREIVEHIEGEVAWGHAHHRLLGSASAVERAGRLLRRFHDAVADFVPPADAVWRFPEMEADSDAWVDDAGKIICHNDPAAWNLVIGADRWAFIDWDVSGPRPFIWDVAYAAIGIVPVNPGARHQGWTQPPPIGARLRALADGYGLLDRDRARLADVLIARIRSSLEHLRARALARIAPWDRMWAEGHGDSWAAMLSLAERDADLWRAALV